jgi:hypothetical protein
MDKLINISLRLLALLLPFVKSKESRMWSSAVILIAANIIPAVGAVFFAWPPSSLLLLYWAESAIIGFLNIFRMLSSGCMNGTSGFRFGGMLYGLFLSVFFTFHYGFFMLGHLIFILAIFVPGSIQNNVECVPNAVLGVFSRSGMMMSFLLLAVSHCYAFWAYFIRDRWYRTHEPDDFMLRPYVRIVIMQLTIIFGAVLLLFTGWNAAIIILWVILKTIADMYGLMRDSRQVKKRMAEETDSQAGHASV